MQEKGKEQKETENEEVKQEYKRGIDDKLRNG